MDDASIFEESRSGDFRDMQRVEAACQRWERDLPYIKRAAYGRYAPGFCFGRPGININLRHFCGSSDDFYVLVETALKKRFYQLETRRKYLSILKHFLNWLTVPVNRVTSKCIYAYLCTLLNSRMKPATYSLYLSALRTIFDCFCNLDITHGMELPKVGNGKVSSNRPVLSKAEGGSVIGGEDRINAELQREQGTVVGFQRKEREDLQC